MAVFKRRHNACDVAWVASTSCNCAAAKCASDGVARDLAARDFPWRASVAVPPFLDPILRIEAGKHNVVKYGGRCDTAVFKIPFLAEVTAAL
jgi:hypothetical protein